MTSPLLLPPLLLKRALDDLHDLAGLARGLGTLPGKLDGLHDEIRGLREDLEPLPGDIDGLHEEIRGMRADLKPMPAKLDDVYDGLKPMEHLGAVRENVAPLEQAIVSVREAVDVLEPMIREMDGAIRDLHPRLEAIQAVEPIGTLADRLPGSRRNRGS